MQNYDHKKIEKKWQRIWEKEKSYEARDLPIRRNSASNQRKSAIKPRFYGLIEFPYPSGDGLHVGHIRSNTAMDVIARKRRAEGFNVLYPIGWDAFGLPTENYAIKTGIHPAKVTKTNTDIFRRQLKSLGFSFDWSREINTSDPTYYKWTQWIFLKFFEKGLAYKKKMAINWCPSCKIGLANEEVVDGACERCGTPVEKREKEQWMLAITKYADRLDKELDTVDYLTRIKIQQRNWIGRSEGSEIEFRIKNYELGIKVFTTRADTVFGCTYLVLSPEHPIIRKIQDSGFKIQDDVWKYIEKAKKKSEIERVAEGKEKTGVKIEGVVAINPANNEEILIFVADYVLADYGTGAIMAVPAHDGRDLQFAKKYELKVKPVIWQGDYMEHSGSQITESVFYEKMTLASIAKSGTAHIGEGILFNSAQFNGLNSKLARKQITEYVGGKIVTTYKLRDWIFSRQRYWGEPIPLVFCEKCKIQAENPKQNHKSKIINPKSFSEGELRNPGWFAVAEVDLPVKLPTVEDFKPTEGGESPLASAEKWVSAKCPRCGGQARRETDTMPNWAGSSWYYLAYAMHKNLKSKILNLKSSGNLFRNWLPVDWYNGGMEHTTLHLLYSRFWHKFLFDLGLAPTSEPYTKRTSHGLILGEGGAKMSKSKGNVINPDDLIVRFGADSVRLYEMFMGPFEQPISWDENGIVGARRFLERVWKLRNRIKIQDSRFKNVTRDHESKILNLESRLHQTIKKVTDDIEAMRFNTAVSALMILLNSLEKETAIPLATWKTVLQLIAPFAPHLSEELWSHLGYKKSIQFEPWPAYDAKAVLRRPVTIIVQVNGKVRGSFAANRDDQEEVLKAAAFAHPAIKKWIGGKEVKRVIVVSGRLVNIVI